MHAVAALLLTSLAAAPAPHGDEIQPDIVEVAVQAGRFGTLAQALEAAQLVDVLRGDGPFTVFAPTDEAFAAVPKETLSALLRPENRAELQRVLKLHVVSGRVGSRDAIAAGQAPTLAGETLPITIRDGRLRVGAADVVANDVDARNGVIHVIDRVLVPSDGLKLRPAGRLVIGVQTDSPTRALAAQLGIDPHKTRILTSITKGSPAAKSGLQKYDVLVEVDGMPATSANIKRAKAAAGAGGTIHVVVLRRAERLQLDVGVAVDH